MPDLFLPIWRWKKLIWCNVIGALMLLSWLWTPTRAMWDALDLSFFQLVNTPLASNATWAKMWAITNMRPFDLVVGALMCGLLIKRDWALSANQVRRGLLALFALLVLLVLVRIGFVNLLKFWQWKRAGPSLTVEGAVRLTQLFPDWQAHWFLKDSSEQSFPGDHASVLLMWGMLMTCFTRGGKLLLVWLITLFFMLPRLVAGAHWASDDLVGGVFLAFVAFGWGYYSPYTARLSSLLERLTAPVFRLFNKIPLVNRLTVVSA